MVPVPVGVRCPDSTVMIKTATIRWAMQTTAIAGAGVAAMSLWAAICFGSLSMAATYLAGDRLLFDGRTKWFGSVEQGWEGALTFRTMNAAGRPVRILGARSSCTCALVDNLPITLAPGELKSLDVRVQTTNETGKFDQTIYLYTSYAPQNEVALTVRGMVRGAAPSPIHKDNVTPASKIDAGSGASR